MAEICIFFKHIPPVSNDILRALKAQNRGRSSAGGTVQRDSPEQIQGLMKLVVPALQ